MFGAQDGYEGFPSRKDLMSLNTLENQGKLQKGAKLGDNRSLRTDDIEGAKPRSGLKRNQEQGAYSGLNLPSYSENKYSRAPVRAQAPANDEILKNAANFYGITPPGSPKMQNYEYQPEYQPNPPQLNPKAVANFYGVTPPRSRAADPYAGGYNSEKNISGKDLAGFYGVTPPMSRPGPVQNTGNYSLSPVPDLGNYARPPRPEKDFGVRDQRSPAQDLYGNQIPPKALAGFYGATPPVSRPGLQNNYYGNMPEPDIGNSGYQSEGNLPGKAYANFYGVTPPPSGKVGAYPNSYGQERNTNNPYGGPNAGAYMQNQGLSNKAIANFYGVTPPPTGKPQGNMYEQVDIPPKQFANFYGVTPPPTGKPQGKMYEQVDIPPKQFANFYGITPPPTGKPQGNVYSQEIPPKQYANFYGVTPPPTGKPQGNMYSQEIPAKQYANFYGVTPPATGSKNQIFGLNAAKFFGHDGVDPEFQYAVDMSSKPNNPAGKYNADPYQPKVYNQVSTASRIFNR